MYLRTSSISIELRPGRFTVNNDMITRLENTLRILPAQHLRTLQYIEIRDRQLDDGAEYAGGSTNEARTTSPDTPPGTRNYWIMLDIDSFDPRHRAINNTDNGLHYTLLHEMGHVVDWSTRAFRWMRRHRRTSGYHRVMGRTHNSRLTNGGQEKFADAYADLFFYPRGLNGRRDLTVEAILRSPAFTTLPNYTQLPNGWRINRPVEVH